MRWCGSCDQAHARCARTAAVLPAPAMMTPMRRSAIHQPMRATAACCGDAQHARCCQIAAEWHAKNHIYAVDFVAHHSVWGASWPVAGFGRDLISSGEGGVIDAAGGVRLRARGLGAA